MRMLLSKAGKRFNRDWIFRNIDFEFLSGKSYAITGPNGSGKSTLLQCISGGMEFNSGEFSAFINETAVATENLHRHVSIVAPYLEVIEEMTASEFLQFHGSFKHYLPGISVIEILRTVELEKSAHKQIRYFSSGMKQRIKLAQAVFTNTPLLLLDEPCTNLDATGYKLYHSLITTYCKDKTIIVSSNDAEEYSFCDTKINIEEYK